MYRLPPGVRALLLLLLAALPGCGQDPLPPLVASNIEVTAPMPGRQMSAGYLVFTNNSEKTIIISDVSSPQYARVEMHESLLQDGVSRMRRISELEIPAGSTVRLERGGKHLMLMMPIGNAEQLTLNFLHDDTQLLTVSIPVGARNN